MLERIQHEGNMDHSIAFIFTPFQRLRTARELPLIPRMPLTTTPTASRRWRTLRTNATSFIVLIASTVSLPRWMLLHTSLRLHAVEEQDVRQCQQQEADRATYTGVVNSTCILTCRRIEMEQESQVWGENQHIGIGIQERREHIEIYRTVWTVGQEKGLRSRSIGDKRWSNNSYGMHTNCPIKAGHDMHNR